MRCLMCGRELGWGSFWDVLIGNDPLCSACRSRWERHPLHFTVEGVPAESTYIYNDAFSSCLIQYKECMDEVLKDVFLAEVKQQLHRRYRDYTIVLMPSSPVKVQSRGFSHLQKMFECLQLPMLDPFLKKRDESQKALTAVQRFRLQNEIVLKPGTVLPEQILLADDTITTGSTLRGALHALNGYHGKVRIYAVSANKSWLPQVFGKSM